MPILVALGPAIACAIAAFVVEIVPLLPKVFAHLRKVVREILRTKAKLEWFKEFLSHSAFYGSVVAGAFGFPHGSRLGLALIIVWFVTLLSFSYSIAGTIAKLEEEEALAAEIHPRRSRETLVNSSGGGSKV